MRVGLPREIKPDEYRVGAPPTAVREDVARGHEAIVDAGADIGAGYADAADVKAGVNLVPDGKSVSSCSGLIVKVKEPQAVESSQLAKDRTPFTYLHLAPYAASRDA